MFYIYNCIKVQIYNYMVCLSRMHYSFLLVLALYEGINPSFPSQLCVRFCFPPSIFVNHQCCFKLIDDRAEPRDDASKQLRGMLEVITGTTAVVGMVITKK